MLDRPLNVLIGCEQSGVVREAFRALGHDAWSCDLLASETPSNHHITGDVREVMHMEQWDILAVMHPPCTRLCNSGVRWLHTPPPGRTMQEMWDELDEGAALFGDLLNADHIPHRALENPVMHCHAKERIENFRPHSQSVQPWQFGHDEAGEDNQKKRTCLWLVDLPCLTPTGTLDGSTARADVHNASPGPDRWKERSRFFPGVAAAMADQWSYHAQVSRWMAA